MTDSSPVVRIYGLFSHADPDRRVRYVGMTSQTLMRRAWRHAADAMSGGTFKVHGWIREIGRENVGVVLLEETTEDKRHEREAEWTLQLHTDLNTAIGSRTADETKAKLGEQSSAAWRRDEYRARVLPAFTRTGADVCASGKPAHVRWHFNRGVKKDGCPFC